MIAGKGIENVNVRQKRPEKASGQDVWIDPGRLPG
jgi:hypothetical protein